MRAVLPQIILAGLLLIPPAFAADSYGKRRRPIKRDLPWRDAGPRVQEHRNGVSSRIKIDLRRADAGGLDVMITIH